MIAFLELCAFWAFVATNVTALLQDAFIAWLFFRVGRGRGRLDHRDVPPGPVADEVAMQMSVHLTCIINAAPALDREVIVRAIERVQAMDPEGRNEMIARAYRVLRAHKPPLGTSGLH